MKTNFNIGIDVGNSKIAIAARINDDSPIIIQQHTEDPPLDYFPAILYIPKKRKPIIGEKTFNKKEHRKLRTIRRWLNSRWEPKPYWWSNGKILLDDIEYERSWAMEILFQEIHHRTKKNIRKSSIWKRNLHINEAKINIIGSVFYNSEEKEIFVSSANSAGFEQVTSSNIIDETTAAMLALINLEGIAEANKRYLTFDLGGGGLRIACAELLEDGTLEIQGQVGDTFGCEDLNIIIEKMIIEEFNNQFGQKIELNDFYKNEEISVDDIISIREKFSLEDEITLELEELWEQSKVKLILKRSDFEIGLKPYLHRMQEALNRVFRQMLMHKIGKGKINKNYYNAEIAPELIHKVLLVGGGSYIPAFRNLIESIFTDEQIIPYELLSPLNAVAFGLTYTEQFSRVLLKRPSYSIGLKIKTANGQNDDFKIFNAFDEIYPWYMPYLNYMPHYEKTIYLPGKLTDLTLYYETSTGVQKEEVNEFEELKGEKQIIFRLATNGQLTLIANNRKKLVTIQTPKWYYENNWE